MYVKRTYCFPGSVEIEKLHTWKCRKKGQKRNKKSKPTPDTMKNYNLKKQTDYLRRLIKLNFPNGWHMVLTYDKNNRPDAALAEKQLKNFLNRMRYHMRKAGYELKYIITTEYESKAIHHHVVIDDMPGLIRMAGKQWWHGQANFTAIYESGEVATLAEYLIKETDKTFRKSDVHGTRYSCSRNLEKPTYTEEIVKANTFRKDPVVPDGYVLERDSFVYGVSEVTGYEYQKYTLKKIINRTQKRRC